MRETIRTLFNTACRFQDDADLTVKNHGHGIRVTIERNGEKTSVFLEEMDAKMLCNALASHYHAGVPAPTSRTERRVAALEDLLGSFRDGIDRLLADNPF